MTKTEPICGVFCPRALQFSGETRRQDAMSPHTAPTQGSRTTGISTSHTFPGTKPTERWKPRTPPSNGRSCYIMHHSSRNTDSVYSPSRVPPSSRTSSVLHQQLVPHNRRFLGPGVGEGLPPRSDVQTTPGYRSPTTKSVSSGQVFNTRRGVQADGEAGNKEGQGSPRPVSQPAFPGPEERWLSTPGDQPKTL